MLLPITYCCLAIFCVFMIMPTIAMLVKNHPAIIIDKNEADMYEREEGKYCPYCAQEPLIGQDGLPVCTCEHWIMASGLEECKECNLIYTGWSCPKCKRSNRMKED